MSQPRQCDSATAESTQQVTLLLTHAVTKTVLACFPAENTRGADPGCLTRNEWVKGEGNNEEMWSQRRGVLQAQRGPELPAEGDRVRYRLPCSAVELVSQQPSPICCLLGTAWGCCVTTVRVWLWGVHEGALIKCIYSCALGLFLTSSQINKCM